MKSANIMTNLMLCTLLLCILCVSSNAAYSKKNATDSMEQRYRDWQRRYKRRYGSRDEWQKRFEIYKTNVQLIEDINSQNLPYKLTDNVFADMTNTEFISTYCGYMDHGHIHKGNCHISNDSAVPPSIDWRKNGAVTPIKDQGNCGSCWAFSAIAAVEGINKLKTGKLVSLSEQELVDCDTGKDNQGCNGGYMEKAFDFIIKNGGITTEQNYPYEGRDGKCNNAKLKDNVVKINNYVMVPKNNEEALLAAVAKQPVSVAIDAGSYDFQLYSSGIFSGSCGNNLNHGVTIVGYGEEGGKKYWIVKNSWGVSWGDGGYIKMKRGTTDKNGACGINMEASYPTKSA